MAEAIVGPVMEKLIKAGFQYLHDQVGWQKGLKEELKRLEETCPKIQAVLFASSQAQFTDQNGAFNKWLWQLRDAVDEAEDVLDDLEYVKHEEQLAKDKIKTKVGSAVSSVKREIIKIGKRALKIDPNLKRLEEVVTKLDRVSADVGNFLHILESTKHEQQEQLLELYNSRETGSLPRNDLIGRRKDIEFVMDWLRQPSHEEHQTQITATTLYHNISLLSVVGHGGTGKTALLQQVYNNEITKEFVLKMWVCVSNNFDPKKVIADMLECLKKERPHLESINTLQETLKSAVQFKKFLLILDDIWDEEEERDKRKWENVFAPLASGSLGSKILVTTRMDSVAVMMTRVISKKMETLRLKGLEEDECLQLLNIHAFADVENPDDHEKLRSITVEIVKKLSGSPLAAKVIGGALNSSLNERHWITILNTEFISAKFGQNEILRLSYMFLPGHLRSCFAYCSIFPQDHKFYKEELVRMWIATGFIQPPSDSRETEEDVGGRYFDVLVKKSFFDKSQYEYYSMHDLLHELAQSISAQECFRFVGHEELFSRVSKSIPKSIRHLSIEINNLKVLNMMNFKNLRSLYLIGVNYDQDSLNVLSEIFKEARSLRLLHIDSWTLELIPENIGYLIHLRYLKFRGSFTLLPRSLTKLYHLQFIDLLSYYGLYLGPFRSFPNDMNNLSNLRYLNITSYKKNLPEMYGIGKLISLQRLYGFNVMNKDGYRIGELEHMNNLRTLGIKRLNNVNDAEEACDAKLCDKRDLTFLSLEWDVDMVDEGRTRQKIELDERVLDNLQPHNNLKVLRIIAYMGFRSAIWMNNVHLISNLEEIWLAECFEWQILPPFGQLPFLKYLHLENMPKVKRIENKFHGNDRDCVFPSLEVLEISGLEALDDWFDVVAAADNCLFPCLIRLYLRKCPNLQELPYLPPKLKKLEIINIGWKTLNFCNISQSIPLETLKVRGCPNIAYILLADKIARFEALRYLTIVDCPNPNSHGGHQQVVTAENCQLKLSKLSVNDPSVLLMEPLRSITSLEKLKIKKNDELVSFSPEAEQWFLQLRSSLRFLTINGLKSLQALPSSLENFSSLKKLHAKNVPQLQLLPGISNSLEKLKLINLESLQCLPSSLSTTTYLKTLFLEGIPLLKSLPNLPPSLQYLGIWQCHPELADRYNNLSGSDYHKIAYIPHIDIRL